jgi:subtilisin family serine protease
VTGVDTHHFVPLFIAKVFHLLSHSHNQKRSRQVSPVALANLQSLMKLSAGRPDIRIGLIDGPVATDHPELVTDHLIMTGQTTACNRHSAACRHGTLVAGILVGKRSSAAPAICPGCTVLVRPIFTDTARSLPVTTPDKLAAAIHECVDAGAHILNLSVALARPSLRAQRDLDRALSHAARNHTIVVAASGNQGGVGSTAITRHPWVIPVVAYDRQGRPMADSNLSNSAGRRGLGAPGENVTSLELAGSTAPIDGTSAAAPFVTGTAALLWSLFPGSMATDIRQALLGATKRSTIVPPLLDAWRAYLTLRRGGDYGRQQRKPFQTVPR